MTTSSFLKLVLYSFAISTAAVAINSVLSGLFPSAIVLSTTIFISFLSFCFLSKQRSDRSGKIVATVAAICLFCGLLVYGASPVTLALFSAIFLSLSRIAFYHTRALSIGIDIGFSFLSIVIAFWSIAETHSIFLAFWSFFFCQTLALLAIGNTESQAHELTQTKQKNIHTSFERAYRQAENAVRKVSTSN